MKITQITVSYGVTQGLPEFSNVKPQLTLTATLGDGDDPSVVEAELWTLTKAHVHEQADTTLELYDRPAKYDPAPRYQVMRTYWNEWERRGKEKPEQYVIILPNEISLNGAAYDQKLIHFGPGEARKLRYPYALRVAQQMAAEVGATLLDCSSGDLTPLNLALSVPERDPDDDPRDDPRDDVTEQHARLERGSSEGAPEEEDRFA